ncbi:hypothetical protein [Halegenticoccus tardaugens]|uniref:hypothetical protein n=1 Tax=Halegenticoccus tardaugens TaxID=2071624 RepID=UPI0013E98FC4|nr:hypothetical protein [Halegenticoccus tardaugens]
MTIIQVTVVHVLTLTTILYFVTVAFWILKMEDFLKTRERGYETRTQPESVQETEEGI